MKETLLKLVIKIAISSYWKGRRYQQHLQMFGIDNADNKPYLYNSVRLKKELEKELSKLHIK